MNNDYGLSGDQRQSWQAHGYCVLNDYFTDKQKGILKSWTDELAQCDEQPGGIMKYYEKTNDDRRQLCRVEYFYDFHRGWREFIDAPSMRNVLAELMGEPALLFKEKLNFKLPGGGGFLPHQDAPAFASFGQNFHITMMVALDPSNLANGCLQVKPDGYHKKGVLPQAEDGSLAPEAYKDYDWQPICCELGDVILFDSYMPHFSEKNTSDKPRRAAYITFNRASEGDRRADYYADKREKFPPDYERKAGVDYSRYQHVYNMANPID